MLPERTTPATILGWVHGGRTSCAGPFRAEREKEVAAKPVAETFEEDYQEVHQQEPCKLAERQSHQCAQLITSLRRIWYGSDAGKKGNYVESDIPDAKDIYGRSKLLGELHSLNTLTLRTSIIGHELQSKYSLLNWFLDQKKYVNGYKNAIFSGLTTLEIAKIIHKFIIPNRNLNGVYHLSGNSISKYDLLNLIKNVYKKEIKIIINKKVKINRSLNSNLLKKLTGYKVKNWKKLIQEMFEFNKYS